MGFPSPLCLPKWLLLMMRMPPPPVRPWFATWESFALSFIVSKIIEEFRERTPTRADRSQSEKPRRDFPEPQTIHEKSKKVTVSHQTAYGEESALSERSSNGSRSRPMFDLVDKRPWCTFEFRYLSRDLLELKGHIPASAKPSSPSRKTAPSKTTLPPPCTLPRNPPPAIEVPPPASALLRF